MAEEALLQFQLGKEVTESIRTVLLERGWKEVREGRDWQGAWNVCWQTIRFSKEKYNSVKAGQLVNHFQGSSALTKKDHLARNLRRMHVIHGKAFEFSPRCFILPLDRPAFERFHASCEPPLVWICKPGSGSRGRDIFLFQKLEELKEGTQGVIQEYIERPLLVGGYKFDLRLYVVVRSFAPRLEAFLYSKGLVRFATVKYQAAGYDNVFCHLTNASLNRHAPSFDEDKDIVGKGSKWTLDQLKEFLENQQVDCRVWWAQIHALCALTLLSVVDTIPPQPRSFEMFGFDVLIDASLKPWLLEVNASPAIAVGCAADEAVKIPLLHDIATMLTRTFDTSAHSGPCHEGTQFEALFPCNERTRKLVAAMPESPSASSWAQFKRRAVQMVKRRLRVRTRSKHSLLKATEEKASLV